LWHSGKSFIDFSDRFKPKVSFRMQAQIKNKATLNMRVGISCWWHFVGGWGYVCWGESILVTVKLGYFLRCLVLSIKLKNEFNLDVQLTRRIRQTWGEMAFRRTVLDIRFNNKVNPKTKRHANIRMGGVDISNLIFVLLDIGWFENERSRTIFRLIISWTAWTQKQYVEQRHERCGGHTRKLYSYDF